MTSIAIQDDVFTPGDGDQEELRIVYDGWVVQHLKAGKLVKSFSKFYNVY